MTNQTAADATLDPALEAEVREIAKRAKVASRALQNATSGIKNDLLNAIADALVGSAEEIVAANTLDMERGRERGLTPGLLDRLELTTERVASIASALREVAGLPDPVGEIVRGSTLENGLKLKQVRVPMGVVGMIYEARPNVTVDAAALALKSGNAVILRGGSAALESNRKLVQIIGDTLEAQGLPRELVQTVDEYGREGGVALMRARGLVDVLVPRGGAALIQTVVLESLVPVIETGTGNVHIYVDASADLDKALPIVMNAKTQRVGVCNAAETLLVHEDVAEEFIPRAYAALTEASVNLHADDRTRNLVPGGAGIASATETDWETEYLSLDLAVKVVSSIDEAIEHIRTYSSGHTEVILTESLAASEQFVDEIDAAAIMVNASSRFTDGGMFGLGAELGISTQKLHARGPMGLAELTTTKWIVNGHGQVRP
ncbi:glutamate-5-semialdehyde dehydrogenase [Gulosibacter molinativorax]|uniref:Gamma-glutamyl phosphate reductase n=1 Tax=Gulosibacter molinativorax TaxID=256821 RepID=A0ABT7C3E7_9MICO|nr:glutamate-5-semialdehyde dehydrogenase [Gulosibacter molinativorax]MDJ1369784.1 glutamate-5-semialdehyde dehydrogenase [Gulosibacter molinativorax]QUY61749.1 Gamma-glutamyl phosphate reductase [Gulosibacter molinativorax]